MKLPKQTRDLMKLLIEKTTKPIPSDKSWWQYRAEVMAYDLDRQSIPWLEWRMN